MSISGGVPESISFDGQEFKYVGDTAPTFDDGVVVTWESNAGGKTARKLFTYQPWTITGGAVEANLDTIELLKALKNTTSDVDVVVAMADGTFYQGIGSPTDTISYDPSKATASFDAGGAGEMKKQ